MKKLILLVLSVSIALLSSGCVIAALKNSIPSAGIHVTNNVKDTRMTVVSTRFAATNPNIGTGETSFVPVCGIPPGHNFVVRVKVYDLNGGYLGVSERNFSVWFDSSNRYGESWTVDSYQPATIAYR